MNAAQRRECAEIAELITIVPCRDQRKDAPSHRARMLREAARRALALANALSGSTVDAQIESAFAACRSIRFAVDNARRFNGEFSLTDILAANRLADEALGGIAGTLPAKVPAITKRSLAAHKANWTRRKKGGR